MAQTNAGVDAIRDEEKGKTKSYRAMKGIQGAMAHKGVGEEQSMNNEELDWESEDVRDVKKLIHITSCWVM
jgi:hypothetical protein